MDAQQEQLFLGSLFHDVGKFVIRSCKSGEGKDHSELGEEWLLQYANQLPPGIPAFARLHHARYFREIQETNLTLLVYHADNLSAAGDRLDKEGVFDHRGTPLASIFSRLSLSKVDRQQQFLPLLPMGEQILFPLPLDQVQMGDESYDALLRLFTHDFEQWLQMGRPLGGLPVLLEKYWSTIPSETKRVWHDEKTFPDISLYDHTKTTAAFALALYQYFREQEGGALPREIIPDLNRTQLDPAKPYFRIVGGDFSGVQRFIYTLSSRGALKGLRGRSFFLELLTEHVADELLVGLGLARTNLIFAGGGHFYLLCQNTANTENLIDHIRKTVNRWLREQFGLRLYLTLASVEAGAADLRTERVSSIWQKVGEALSGAKGLRFHHQLKEMMVPCEPLLDGCTVCHRDDLAPEELGPLHSDDPDSPHACHFCRALYYLGDELTRERPYLIAQQEKQPFSENVLRFPTRDGSFLTYRLYNNLRGISTLERGFVLNSWTLTDYTHPFLSPLFYGGHIAQVEDLPATAQKREREENPTVRPGATASLAGLACVATGSDRIAALRIDVDNMGKLLSRGFPSPSFSRLASFSRQLSLFFKYHLNAICEEKSLSPCNLSEKPLSERGRLLGVVYSGGDDLFVIGAWDEVIEFAFDVEQAFRLFTGNPEITLSGGVVIQDPHFPLYHMAEEAGQAEDRAKDQGRNRLTLGFFSDKQGPRQEQQTYTWQEMETQLIPLLQNFLALGEYETDTRRVKLKLPKAFIYRLFGLIEEWQNDGQLYLPRMAYTLRRLQEAIERNNMQIEWGNIQRALMTPENMAQLRTVLTWMELLCRSSQEITESA